MSIQTPPTLQKLARQALLRDEALAISSLEDLPPGLFPALFMEAFTGRHNKLVKAMVAAWPFPCLPLRALMKTPCHSWETFQAVLDGVDMRQAGEFHPRRAKLQVLDLRNAYHPFYKFLEADTSRCSAETLQGKQILKVFPRYALRQHLKVIVDLHIWSSLNKEQKRFLKWAHQRKDSLHLCCTRMKIWALSHHIISMILNIFDPEDITELELIIECTMFPLADFAPYFGQMRNLRKVLMTYLPNNTFQFTNKTRLTEAECFNRFISQISQFNCLQHLFMNRVHFLTDQMNQILGSLMTTLETLSITHCQISQSDFDSFSCCQSLFQLKHLEMTGVVLLALNLMPLRGLLEKVANTLETLNLQGCRLKDSQLNALLPALRQCSQLSNVNFSSNDFSMPILEDLLQHTANWSKMSVERYPAPLECYDEWGHLSRERFAQLSRGLVDTLRAIRQPKNISFATDICLTCGERSVYHQVSRLCWCWQ